MSNKNKVIVRIFGQEYTMVGCETREYIQRIANYVDDKMVDTAKNSKKLSTAMVAVLTSLNIADEYFKLKEQLTELEKEAMEPLRELEQTRSQLAAATMELKSRETEYKENVKRLEEEKNVFSKNDEVYDQLTKEMDQLRKALELINQENEKLAKMNDDLQNKLFNSQIKYVQTRKELEAFIETFDEEKNNKSNNQ